MKNWKSVAPILSVLLFAIYPVLALYAFNVDELELNQLLFPLFFSLGFTLILFVLWLIILKNILQASLATVLLLVIFWNYGLLYMGITKLISLKHWHLMPVMLFIYFHLVYFIRKARNPKTLYNLNTIVLLPIFLLIVINVITILPAEFKKFTTLNNNHKVNLSAHEGLAGKYFPDIYIIILDEYAGFKTIKEEWGYDNKSFNLFLKDKGFFIAENSKSRFTGTVTSLPTLMNIEYADGNLTEVELYQRYNNNFLFSYLDKTGYKIVFLDGFSRSQHTLNQKNILHLYYEYIDIKHGNQLVGFSDLVVKQSMFGPLIIIDENADIYYQANKYFFNYIKNYPLTVNKTEQPGFLYAHINCPHLPYVFDRNGDFSENPTNYWEYKSLPKNLLKKLYLEQYIYVTKRMTNIVSEILKASENEPVIILLSDHGPREVSSGNENPEHFQRVLNAVYFPDGDYGNLYDSIAPVNTLRVVLNKYFDKNYKMLEDK
jgi:hypothetical protein